MVTSPSPTDLLTGQLASVLGVDARQIDTGRPLTELGLEPGSATLLRQRLRESGNADLSVRRLLGGGSVRSLAALLARPGTLPSPVPPAPDPVTPLGSSLLARLASHAGGHGLAQEDALFAAVALTAARWTCGTGVLEVTVEQPAGDTVRVPAPDVLHWAGFAAYARDLRAVAPGPAAALRPGAAAARLRLRPDPGAPGAEGAEGAGRTVLSLVLDRTATRPGARWASYGGPGAPGDMPLEAGLGTAFGRLVSLLAGDREAWRRTDLGWDPTFAFQEPLTVRPFPDAGPLLDGPLRAAAERTPHAPALLDSSAALTHGELAARAGHVAGLLRQAGVRPGSPVAVVLPKGFDQIAAVTGVAQHGSVYVPVDVSWPGTRIAAVCRRAGIAHALVAPGSPAELPGGVAPLVLGRGPDGEGTGVLDEPAGVPGGDPGSPAYIIFTSGSTGEPKGVVVDHAAARVTVDDITDRLRIGPQDRVLGLSALSFDLSVYDVFGVLGAGGALVLPEQGGEQDPQHWLELIEQHRVTFWNTAPALMQMLLDLADADPAAAARQLASLRCVLLSGDWIPVTLPDRLRALVPGVEVVSAGGATEAAIWSICHPVGNVPEHWRSIPYGRPLRDQFFHILDDEGRPLPVGHEGELHIAGRGLARGYAGDEEQTAARFPVHEKLGERVYRTGDLGMWRTDGTIEFLGRKDRQVKVRGHRIELGEIESVLDRLPAVRRAVASVVREADGRPRLMAYVALTPGALARNAGPVRAELLDALRQSVPSYMVPQRLVLTDALPVTANGKVDHARLADVTDRADGAGTAAAAAPTGAGGDGPAPRSALADAVAEAVRRGLTVRVSVTPGPDGDAEVRTWAGTLRRDGSFAVAADAHGTTLTSAPFPAPTGAR
ncbi:amino acid adenylation domain-containing protein [Streptomyces ovatisporus]|uniref:Amino acid adenylation domain-containing protein n=1 Tax=Streptomyces ovatisporus TaxID=1128682 RepID=A0ABV9A9D7_9ACTN